jgi:hypothetical protein
MHVEDKVFCNYPTVLQYHMQRQRMSAQRQRMSAQRNVTIECKTMQSHVPAIRRSPELPNDAPPGGSVRPRYTAMALPLQRHERNISILYIE